MDARVGLTYRTAIPAVGSAHGCIHRTVSLFAVCAHPIARCRMSALVLRRLFLLFFGRPSCYTDGPTMELLQVKRANAKQRERPAECCEARLLRWVLRLTIIVLNVWIGRSGTRALAGHRKTTPRRGTKVVGASTSRAPWGPHHF